MKDLRSMHDFNLREVCQTKSALIQSLELHGNYAPEKGGIESFG
jgi:hypothetical protein